MFVISSHRVERAMTVHTVEVNSKRNENLIHKGIIYAVEMHHKAMGLVSSEWCVNIDTDCLAKYARFISFHNFYLPRFVKVYISKMEVPFFLIIVTGVISSSLNLFQVRFIVYSYLYYQRAAFSNTLLCQNICNNSF